LKVKIPLAITFATGMLMVVVFFVPRYPLSMLEEELQHWASIVGAFALVLGISSLMRTHVERIRRRRRDWGYSFVTIGGFVLTAALGIGWGVKPPSPFDWVFKYVMTPLDATVFSLLAFFIASAAYRTFRARTPEATVMLLTALFVMIGRVPVGDSIAPHGALIAWAAAVGLCIVWAAYPWLRRQTGGAAPFLGLLIVAAPIVVISVLYVKLSASDTYEWLMDLSVAGKRGILLGVALGVIATSLRIVLGIERGHLGEGS
jgi:hypothetical protein